MWKDKGRSGYGDSTIGGDYDSWDGISSNGRQYRNEATMETRDLSGWDYWHLRKQNRPTEHIPVSLHMLNKDRANIDAYSVLDTPVKKKSSISIEDKILPQAKRIRTLTEQLIELEVERKAGMDIHTYSKLRDILICKRERAQELYEKAVSVKPKSSTQSDDVVSHSVPEVFNTNAANQPKNLQQNRKFDCNSAVRDAIVFLTGSLALLVLVKVIF